MGPDDIRRSDADLRLDSQRFHRGLSLGQPPPKRALASQSLPLDEKWTGWDLNPECLRTMARCLFTSRYLSATPQIRTHDLDFASWSSSRYQRSELTQSRHNRALARTATITLRSCRAFLPLFLRGSQRPSDIPGSRLNRFL